MDIRLDSLEAHIIRLEQKIHRLVAILEPQANPRPQAVSADTRPKENSRPRPV